MINGIYYDLWVQHVLGIGSSRITELLEKFHDTKGIYDELMRASTVKLTPQQLARAKETELEYSEKILAVCEKHDIKLIGISDCAYPQRLRNIPAPPIVLYYKGRLPDVDALPLFCIVGPRKISEFGEKAAYSLARRLSLGGMTVVSGIAVGGDSAVHEGALSVNKAGIAVSPCGLARDYLVETRFLREEILKKGGCILSEFPPEHPVTQNSFHIRNRLLSGLAVGTAVIEAGNRSGTLITARYALEQNREVFVIPGNPTLSQYKGSNKLIADGAKPLLDAQNIFDEYKNHFNEIITPEKAFAKQEKSENNKKIQKISCETLSKEAKIVYNRLDKPRFSADDLLNCGLSDDELLAVLTELEMNGLIEQLAGGFYTLM